MSGIVIGATIGNDLDGEQVEQVVDAWLTRPADATAAPVLSRFPNRAGAFADRAEALAFLRQWQHLYPAARWVLQDDCEHLRCGRTAGVAGHRGPSIVAVVCLGHDDARRLGQ